MVDDNALLEDITNAVRGSFDACRDRVGATEILGYAICSDDTAITCSPVVASQKGLLTYAHETADDFRFNPDEWTVQEGLEHVQAVGDVIYSLYEESEDYENNDDWHKEYRTRIYDLFVQALERLDAAAYFGTGRERDNIFVMAWVSDSNTPRERGAEWSRRLNRPAMHKAFMNWLATTDYWS